VFITKNIIKEKLILNQTLYNHKKDLVDQIRKEINKTDFDIQLVENMLDEFDRLNISKQEDLLTFKAVA
jgi:hypothetical protein